MEMDSSAFDIRAELDDVLSLFAEKVRSKDVELAGLVQLSIPQMLLGDSGRFRQVLINLVGTQPPQTSSLEASCTAVTV